MSREFPPGLPVDPESVKGFLDAQEGRVLYEAALNAAKRGPCLEVGSYCGKSTVYLGAACKEAGGVLFALDHHYGSEENQRGWDHHDAALYDAETGRLNTLPEFRRTLRRAQLEDTVVSIVAPSNVAARGWATPLSLVFIDGGHGSEPAMDDYNNWTPHLIAGGWLAIHDVFPDPRDGGRPPYEIYRLALQAGFVEERAVKSLRILRRK